jgi:hypothetical protein
MKAFLTFRELCVFFYIVTPPTLVCALNVCFGPTLPSSGLSIRRGKFVNCIVLFLSRTLIKTLMRILVDHSGRVV